jgi:hypothetical protein
MNRPAAPASAPSTACPRSAAPSACTRAAAATARSGPSAAAATTGPHAGGRRRQRQAQNENSAQQRGRKSAFRLAMRFKKAVHRQCPFLSG